MGGGGWCELGFGVQRLGFRVSGFDGLGFVVEVVARLGPACRARAGGGFDVFGCRDRPYRSHRVEP